MPDREKVLKGLEICKEESKLCFGESECGYQSYFPRCWITLAADALALLKAQEPEAMDAPKPDSDIGCWYDITHNYTLEQVVSALKAQAPRVMTWREIVDKATEMPFVWLESKNIPDRVFQSIIFKTWLFASTVTIITVMEEGWLFEGYQTDCGKKWRCWTSRPDEKMRAETPWE